MHLLALLISAVLSSQFVEPNAMGAITLTPDTVTLAELKSKLPPIGIALATGTNESAIVWSLAATSTLGEQAIALTTEVTGSDTPYTFTHATTDLSKLYAAGDPADFYLHAVAGADAENAKITVTPPVCTVDVKKLSKEELEAGKAFELTEEVTSAWTKDLDIFWAFSNTPSLTESQYTDSKTKGKTAASAPGVVTATFTAAMADELGELTDNKMYIFAGISDAACRTSSPATVLVTKSAFTVTTPTVPEPAPSTGFTLTLKAMAGVTWAAEANVFWAVGISSTLDAAALGGLTATGTFPVVTAGTASAELSDAMVASLSGRTDQKVYVYAGLKDASGAIVNTPVTVVLTKAGFTVTGPTTTDSKLALGVTFPLVGTSSTWSGKPSVFWAVSSSPYVDAITLADLPVKGTIATPGSDTVNAVITPAMAAEIGPLQDNKFYFYAGLTNAAGAVLNTPQAVTVNYPSFTVDKGKITKDQLDAGLTFELTQDVAAPWSAQAKIWWALANSPSLNEAALTALEAKGEFTVTTLNKANVIVTTEIAEEILTLSNNKLYIYAGVATAAAAAANPPATVIVTTTAFTVDPTSVNYDVFAAGLDFTLGEAPGSTWVATKDVFWAVASSATLDAAALAGLNARGLFRVTAAKAAKAELTDVMAASITGIQNNKVYVYAGLETAAAAVLNTPVAVTIRPKAFTVTPPTVISWVLAAGATFTITAEQGTTWAKDAKVWWAVANAGNLNAAALEDLETSGEFTVATAGTVTAEVTAAIAGKIGTLTDNKIYFYAGIEDAAGAAANLPTAVTVRPTAFTVAPDTITEEDLEDALEFALAETPGSSWAVDAKVFWAVANSATLDAAGLAALDAKGEFTVATLKTAKAALTKEMAESIGTITGGKIYVYAGLGSYAAAVANAPVIVTIGGAETPSFTITPTDMDWAATLTTPVITVTPNAAAAFPLTAGGTFKAIFSYSDKDDIEKAIAVAEGTTAGTKVYTIPATDLSDFEIAGDVAKDVKVSINNGVEVLEHTVNFNIKKKADSAAMGVSPLVSLLAALVFLFVKLF